ncbi:acyltransferase [Blautia pseudococcoides]|uniref:acyltransferase n=1 Tax=Blautia pseudococcoides TaxID=1796616 RepID=UPI00148AEA00|nr:acyltransferase [Blautia pseudococcoides]QJU14633.1 acyltransferase [Blautia pseudococcoides]
MKIKDSVKVTLGRIRVRIFGVSAGSGVYIGKHCSLKGKQRITLDDSVIIRPYVQIWSGGAVRIGEGSEVGERCRISIANSLKIGKKVLLSPNVYITDCDHEYRNVVVPVIDQGIVQKGQKVSIGDGSYIGINAVIVGNVEIGKHCVIGANSVVTKDVPDYSVAVGSPAKVIKKIN